MKATRTADKGSIANRTATKKEPLRSVKTKIDADKGKDTDKASRSLEAEKRRRRAKRKRALHASKVSTAPPQLAQPTDIDKESSSVQSASSNEQQQHVQKPNETEDSPFSPVSVTEDVAEEVVAKTDQRLKGGLSASMDPKLRNGTKERSSVDSASRPRPAAFHDAMKNNSTQPVKPYYQLASADSQRRKLEARRQQQPKFTKQQLAAIVEVFMRDEEQHAVFPLPIVSVTA